MLSGELIWIAEMRPETVLQWVDPAVSSDLIAVKDVPRFVTDQGTTSISHPIAFDRTGEMMWSADLNDPTERFSERLLASEPNRGLFTTATPKVTLLSLIRDPRCKQCPSVTDTPATDNPCTPELPFVRPMHRSVHRTCQPRLGRLGQVGRYGSSPMKRRHSSTVMLRGAGWQAAVTRSSIRAYHCLAVPSPLAVSIRLSSAFQLACRTASEWPASTGGHPGCDRQRQTDVESWWLRR